MATGAPKQGLELRLLDTVNPPKKYPGPHVVHHVGTHAQMRSFLVHAY